MTSATIPARDVRALAAAFRGVEAPPVAQRVATDYQVGDVAPFWVSNLDTNDNLQIEAALVYRSDALNMWLQAGEHVNEAQVREAAAFIETRILPTNRTFFGNEWQPGIDGDRRVNILHVRAIGGAAGYFSSADEYVTAVNPFSNQREMIYASLQHAPIGSNAYYGLIAHEMQHLIQWHTDHNEEAWLNEGMAELAVHLNGLPTYREPSYVNQTDVQLTMLRYEPEVAAAHYAAAFLFSAYFLDRFGEEATTALVRHPENGPLGFEAILADLEAGMSFDDLFADWLVANYLQSIGRGQGAHQYHTLDLPPIRLESNNRFPATTTATVNQYGADYVQLLSDAPLTVVFTGTQQVNLVDTTPHSGRYFWSSLPADESNMTLTRAFDLTAVDTATLSFWTWYEIEAGWDYGYVAVSGDDGRSWELLETASTTRDNPQGNSFGPGFTGVSGNGNQPVWIQETADLTPYAGQHILLRFQYVTDDAIHDQGFLIDDITIPELGYSDDVEGGDAGWEAAGFARTTHLLPQRFMIQLILPGPDSVKVEQLQLDENQQGQWQIPLDNETREAILIISGNTPVTRRPAVYTMAIENP